jgi:hypothetical protein
MTREPSAVSPVAPSRPSRFWWIDGRALWAGVSIVMMWLAVLLVGIFGGDFVSSSAANGFTKIPDVVFMLPFVLPATIVVARRGFAASTEDRGTARDAGPQVPKASVAEAAPIQTRDAA